jgi:hypothetical protein
MPSVPTPVVPDSDPPSRRLTVELGTSTRSRIESAKDAMLERIAALIDCEFVPADILEHTDGTRESMARAYLETPEIWFEPIIPLFMAEHYASAAGVPSGVCPLVHYLDSGRVDPHPVFQTWHYAGVSKSLGKLTPLEHYLTVADPLTVSPNPLFDARIFLDRLPFSYPEHLNPLQLFLWLWPRRVVPFSPYVDIMFYAKQFPEVLDRVDPLTHYFTQPKDDRGDLNPRFFRGWYLESYPDLAIDARDCFLHFLLHGADEGRLPNPLASADLDALRRTFIETPVGALAREYIKVRTKDLL